MSKSVNDRQVGGLHYKSTYQHWDFVIDSGIHYLYGCATKYLSRWKKKGGVLDLEKAIHYLEKAMDAELTVPQTVETETAFKKFCAASFEEGWAAPESKIFELIYRGREGAAVAAIREMIVDTSNHPQEDER